MSSIPKCLTDYRDAIRALSELEDLRNTLENKPKNYNLGMEIRFLTDQIDTLNRDIDLLEKKTSKVFKLLQKHNPRAHLYASLNFRCGYKWDDIAELCDTDSVECLKAVVYRALNDLRKRGYIID